MGFGSPRLLSRCFARPWKFDPPSIPGRSLYPLPRIVTSLSRLSVFVAFLLFAERIIAMPKLIPRRRMVVANPYGPNTRPLGSFQSCPRSKAACKQCCMWNLLDRRLSKSDCRCSVRNMQEPVIIKGPRNIVS